MICPVDLSAIAARVIVAALSPPAIAIGIEFAQIQKRETVYLRELLDSTILRKTKAKLRLVLGKTIGGEALLPIWQACRMCWWLVNRAG